MLVPPADLLPQIDDVEDMSDEDSKVKDDPEDITKDSLIKAPKKRKAPAKAKGKTSS